MAPSAAFAGVAGLNGGACSYNSIQDAIDAAGSGDTVYVETGTYYEALNITEGIDLKAADAGCATASTTGSVVVSDAGVPATVNSASTVSFHRFTLRDGATNLVATSSPVRLVDSVVYNAAGRGVVGVGGSLVLLDSDVLLNDGGGIDWDGGTVVVQDSIIQRNTSVGDAGGGIRIANGTLQIHGASSIYNNEAAPYFAIEGGGCIAAFSSTVDIYGSTEIYNCRAESSGGLRHSGGALYLDNSFTEIWGLAEVRDSDASYDGGLIFVQSGTLDVRDNVLLSGGDAWQYGGNIAAEGDAQLTFMDAVKIAGGRAATGGGVSLIGTTYFPRATVMDAVQVVDNHALADGGGAFVSHGRWEQFDDATVGSDQLVPNRAERGGGLFLEDDAVAIFGDPADASHWVDVDAGGFPLGGPQVRLNIATEAGGGIYAHDGAYIEGTGMAIYRNKAVGPGTGDGGCLAVIGETTEVRLDNSLVNANRARIFGGGVYAHLGGFVSFDAIPNPDPEGELCPLMDDFNRYCSEVRDNEAGRPADGTTGDGGGVHVGPDGAVELRRTALVGNRSQVSAPQVYVAAGGAGLLSSSLVADATIDMDWPATQGVVTAGALYCYYSTFAGDGTTVLYQPGPTSTGAVVGNVVWPDGGIGSGMIAGTFIAPAPATKALVNTGLISDGVNVLDNTDPLFVTTLRGDYRIDAASPAFEAPTNGAPYGDDIEQCPRIGVTPDHGSFEVGPCP